MKNLKSVIKSCYLIVGFAPVAFLTSCIDPNAGSYPSYPNSYGNSYGSPGYGSGYGDPYYRERRDIDRDRQQADRERRDIENERDRVDAERRRIEQERARQYSPPAPPPRRQESCPSGFSQSENKCSSEERRRGCRDMRLPGGLGCVSR